jgi:hypothetical protein
MTSSQPQQDEATYGKKLEPLQAFGIGGRYSIPCGSGSSITMEAVDGGPLVVSATSASQCSLSQTKRQAVYDTPHKRGEREDAATPEDQTMPHPRSNSFSPSKKPRNGHDADAAAQMIAQFRKSCYMRDVSTVEETGPSSALLGVFQEIRGSAPRARPRAINFLGSSQNDAWPSLRQPSSHQQQHQQQQHQQHQQHQ